MHRGIDRGPTRTGSELPVAPAATRAGLWATLNVDVVRHVRLERIDVV